MRDDPAPPADLADGATAPAPPPVAALAARRAALPASPPPPAGPASPISPDADVATSPLAPPVTPRSPPAAFVVGDGAVEPAGRTETVATSPLAGTSDLTVHADVDLASGLGGGPTPIHPERTPYRVLREIGRGGMGVVFAAEQCSLRREIALKALLATGGDDVHHAEQRFVEEARVTARLDHPNVISVHELGRDAGGRPFIAMKLVRGTSWRALIQAEDGAPARGLRDHLDILLRVCDAVAFAHAHGVIHRDLKPANVMVGAYGEVLVMDWGLALELWRDEPWPEPGPRPPDGAPGAGPISAPPAARSAPRATPGSSPPRGGSGPAPGSASASTSLPELAPLGTPRYMAPELALGDPSCMGPHTDVYLLGGILYELLTGTPPHPGDTRTDVILAAAKGRVEPPERRAPERRMPPLLAAVAMRALEPDPARRYPSVADLASAIRDYLRNEASLRLVDVAEQALAPLEARAGDGSGAPLRSAELVEVYGALAAVHGELREASKLWPDNLAARDAASRAHLAHARLALRQGDLAAAEAELALVEPGPHRASALTRLEHLRAARLGGERRRRLGLGAAGLVAVASIAIGALAARSEGERRRASEAARLRRQQAVAHSESVAFTDYERRIGAYEAAVAADPTWVEGWLELSWAYLARAYYVRGLRDPEQATLDLERTLAPLERALEQDPGSLQARTDRLYMLEALGEGERAAAEARALVALSPGGEHGIGASALVAFVEGRYDEAEALWTRQIDLGPSVREVPLYWRAFARFLRADFAGARADLDLCLVDWPTDESYLALEALCFLAEGDDRASARAVLRILDSRERAAHAPVVLACLAARRGDAEEAAALERVALAERVAFARCFYYPTFWGALDRLPPPFHDLGGAASLAGGVSGLQPVAPAPGIVARARGEARFEQGAFDLALADATLALADNPADGRARLLRARCLAELGQARDAALDLGLVPRLAPTRAAAARALLARLEAGS